MAGAADGLEMLWVPRQCLFLKIYKFQYFRVRRYSSEAFTKFDRLVIALKGGCARCRRSNSWKQPSRH